MRFEPSTAASIRSVPSLRSNFLSLAQLNAKASGIPERTGVGELFFVPPAGMISMVYVVFTCTVVAILPPAESVTVVWLFVFRVMVRNAPPGQAIYPICL